MHFEENRTRNAAYISAMPYVHLSLVYLTCIEHALEGQITGPYDLKPENILIIDNELKFADLVAVICGQRYQDRKPKVGRG